METTNKQLMKVYNGNETIANSGFLMQSKYIVPLLARMKDEEILNDSACVLIQTILSYKHTEKNPFPSNKELAELLGRTLRSVQKAMSSIREAGVLLITKMVDKVTGKEKRNNQYDFTPFFAILEKFIVEMQNKNYDVTISDIMGTTTEATKSEKPVPAIASAKKEDVTPAPPETLQVAPQATEEVPEVFVPETILNVARACSVDAEGIIAIKDAYAMNILDESVIIGKIYASKDKKNFTSYFNTCIGKAIENNEQPALQGGQPSYKGKPTREEKIPEWFAKLQEEKNKPKKHEPSIEEMTFEELLQREIANNRTIEMLPDMPQGYAIKERIDLAMKKFNKEGAL